MSGPHEGHTATLLNDGRVLIAGGFSVNGTVGVSVAAADLYDILVGRTFSSAGDMLSARNTHTAIRLASGNVLLIGGYASGPASAEIYNPSTGVFTATAGGMVVGNRGRATASLLNDGRVLITGGQVNDIVNTAEIYNPSTNNFAATGSMSEPRNAHTATTLADGSVIVAGGFDQPSNSSYILPLASMERWLPGSGTSVVPAGGMATRRGYHTALRLQEQHRAADGRRRKPELDDRQYGRTV